MRTTFVLAIALGMGVAKNTSAEPVGWQIDPELGVQLVYLPSGAHRADVGPRMVPLLKNIPAFAPDIDNIVYKNILALGFPLPSRKTPEALKLYLKLYAWPTQLSHASTARQIFNEFLLDQLPDGERWLAFVRSPRNVFVKVASIDRAARTFSASAAFQAPAVPSQAEFDASLPFSSVYVRPSGTTAATDEGQRAAHSATGVTAVHEALLRVYAQNLALLAQKDGKRFYGQARRCSDDIERVCGMRVFEIQEKPSVFSNYRELPMPQDAKQVFLSGLLLVKMTDYAAKRPLPWTDRDKGGPGVKAFEASYRPVWSHLLEVGSVFDLRGKTQRTR